MQNKTIITAFFDLKRETWPCFKRDKNVYLTNAKINLSLNENMIIFIENQYVDFVTDIRKDLLDKTRIIITSIDQLPKYKLYDKVKKIMYSEEYRKGLVLQKAPETWNPNYNIVIWSKTDLVSEAIKINPFESTHFAWLDFGLSEPNIHQLLPDQFDNKIKLMCRKIPERSDLDRIKMCKSHKNRFAAGFVTASLENWLWFSQEADREIDICIDLGVVDGEQTMYSNVYLQYPEKFKLYYGEWENVISAYHNVF